MDDVIVIILTLVLTIVAAINQQKKRKKQVPSEEESEPDFWQEVLMGGKTETSQEPVREPIKTIPSPEKRPEQQYKKPVEQVFRNTVKTSRFNYPDKSDEGGRNDEVLKFGKGAKTFGSETPAEEQTETILEDFSLKKAVIYSEIIQPKYF
jgi:hypothetical protein